MASGHIEMKAFLHAMAKMGPSHPTFFLGASVDGREFLDIVLEYIQTNQHIRDGILSETECEPKLAELANKIEPYLDAKNL
ncbi:hypothetical protein [Glutamicibacter protophormiae]|uniref:hypothetical protein n=1 Tax=Glutamicibacter protophormiae TaxID=37930 RepID=UPI003A91D99E